MRLSDGTPQLLSAGLPRWLLQYACSLLQQLQAAMQGMPTACRALVWKLRWSLLLMLLLLLPARYPRVRRLRLGHVGHSLLDCQRCVRLVRTHSAEALLKAVISTAVGLAGALVPGLLVDQACHRGLGVIARRPRPTNCSTGPVAEVFERALQGLYVLRLGAAAA